MDCDLKSKAKTVVVGMSGGVDSSVVALILKKQGYNVIGLHMTTKNDESSKKDEDVVRSICKKYDIELNIVKYEDEMQKVKDYFKQEYIQGKTPNPCVICNKIVKFAPFVDYANQIGADYFATGHYAKICHNDYHILITAKDTDKDQTYFLNQLSQSQLQKALFPLGDYTKEEVRKIAKDFGLENADKKDSYDVCFLGNEKFKDYAEKIFPSKPGKMVDVSSGVVVGRHNGLEKYTIGQRKGLGIGGGFGASGEAWFVSSKDIEHNILYVAQGSDDALYSSALVSKTFNWIPCKPKESEFECYAKFRYRQKNQKVNVKINENGCVEVLFADKQRAITLGQFVVLYKSTNQDDVFECLGGGVIDEIIK